jgi:hypothetical protein
VSIITLRVTPDATTSFLTLEAPLHALARMFERGKLTDAEVRTSLNQATEAFLATDRFAMDRAARAGEDVILPAAPGLFIGKTLIAKDDRDKLRLFYRARTFVGIDDALPEQTPPLPADAPATNVLYRPVAGDSL